MTATMTPADVRSALLARDEIALLDVREEDPYAQSHPLWAANLPLSRLELDAWGRIPRRDTVIVTFDDGEGYAATAAQRLGALGYTRVHVLEGGLAGWRAAGYELFRDVNVPSKAFGELVEAQRHTPSLSASEVQALLDARADVVVLDARRYDEYQTMNIPGATSVPGGELVLRARELAPDPATRIIVNCAGRTRSIIGTQSLVNAGVPNPVAALRNGTIGWTLAGQALEHGAARRAPDTVDPARQAEASRRAVALARRAGVAWIGLDTLAAWRQDLSRTTYAFDVRTPEAYAAGHRAGFRSAPGGQLVQETDVHVPVRGARIVLCDDDGVRAPMAASWLAQMGWEVAVLDAPHGLEEAGPDTAPQPASPAVPLTDAETLAAGLQRGDVLLLDVTSSAKHVQRHIPGAWFVLRAELPQRLPELLARSPGVQRVVLTCGSGGLARHAALDITPLTGLPVSVLDGGNNGWLAAGRPVERGEQRLASPRIDRYRRPYEGTDNAAAAMQAYLDWEFGLVAQLGRDGTHHFHTISGEA